MKRMGSGVRRGSSGMEEVEGLKATRLTVNKHTLNIVVWFHELMFDDFSGLIIFFHRWML